LALVFGRLVDTIFVFARHKACVVVIQNHADSRYDLTFKRGKAKARCSL
jgi:hypothetical protein